MGNNGGSKKLKLKGNQEFILFDADIEKLKGKKIVRALFHFENATPEKYPAARVGISSIAAQWYEGRSNNYRFEKGSSCFAQARYNERDWTYSGSSILDVVFGRGNTIWEFADCSLPNKDGWQSCAVEPDVVAARIAGLSHGFCMIDEIGSTWSIENEKFEYHFPPNRYIFSREKKGGEPWLEIRTENEDRIPPDPVASCNIITDDIAPGEALVSWKTPEDHGGGKPLGFNVFYLQGEKKIAFPRYLIPMAGKPGEVVWMHIQDIPFRPGEEFTLVIETVDSCSNISDAFEQSMTLSNSLLIADIPVLPVKQDISEKALPVVAGIKVSVIDLLDKVDPLSGQIISERTDNYIFNNHIFNSDTKEIKLQAAKNEFVTFQVLLQGKADNIFTDCIFDRAEGIKAKLFEFAYVNTGDEPQKYSILPDPLVPLKKQFSMPSTAGNVKISEQKSHTIICELYIPHDTAPGKKRGKFLVKVSNETLELDIDLTVWNFTLPDKLSFVPEMNAYGTVSPYKDYSYYRLAHEHRTCINRLPYGWDGSPTFAPPMNEKGFKWTIWDKKVGPLFDGSAFNDLPRTGEPVDVFYLPFNESWPVSLFDHYTPSYWADEAFDEKYKNDLQKAFNDFAKHCEEKKWNDTIFQFYLNNKIIYRKKYEHSSAPWLFDEPVNTQDFWALRWYGMLWHSAVKDNVRQSKLWFRGDISYSEFSRDMLWGIMDIEYIGSNNIQKTRMKADEQISYESAYFSEYGSANMIKDSNTIPAVWCVAAWARGAMGVMPWQTIGDSKSWQVANRNSLFYPGKDGPVPSVRLKAFTRGQQDVEYLQMAVNNLDIPRYALANWIYKIIGTREFYINNSYGEHGDKLPEEIKPDRLWEIRYLLGKILSEKAPPYKRSLVEWETIPFSKRKTQNIGNFSAASLENPGLTPGCDTFKPVN